MRALRGSHQGMPSGRSRLIVALLIWSGASGTPMPSALALGRRSDPGLETVSWLVYWDTADSRRTLEAQASRLDEIAVFAYHFREDGRLVPANPWVTQVIAELATGQGSQRPRILVSVVNDLVVADGSKRLKDPHGVHEALASPEALAAHRDQLLEIVGEADGLELDYENLLASDREAFSALVRSLAEALHAQRKRLSVVVQAKTQDHHRDGAGAMDWEALAAHADRIKVMAYHYHHARGSPGPLAPPAWVEQLAGYALTQIPTEKLCMVLTLHGFDWPEGGTAQALDAATALRLAAVSQAESRRDPASVSPYFQYTSPDGVPHTVWFEDAVSLREKILFLRRAGVSCVGFWHLGAGDELIRDVLGAAHEEVDVGR